MKRKILTIAFVAVFAISLVACGKKTVNETPTPGDYNDVGFENTDEIGGDDFTDPDLNVDIAEGPEVTPEVTPTPAEGEEPGEDTTEQAPVVVYAKTYKEVNPDLYTYYPEAGLTYTKWIYKIDKDSNFIGSIIYPDGTILEGQGKAEGEVIVDEKDYTGESKPSTEPIETEPEEPKDKTINPMGEDFTMAGTNGDILHITTKTVKDAVIDKTTQTDFRTEFTTGEAKYVLSVDTVDATMNKLFTVGIYQISGEIYINNEKSKVTEKGTFTQYDILTADGLAPYAVTYVPNTTLNTVYMLTADTVENATNLLDVMVAIIEE